ncbi:MAG: leucine-rich repeat domain-containing protein, partial [Clostridiales bacterium]|nr:leucine-rich repeat domain-containing protein [Clostridiales bacterium]
MKKGFRGAVSVLLAVLMLVSVFAWRAKEARADVLALEEYSHLPADCVITFYDSSLDDGILTRLEVERQLLMAGLGDGKQREFRAYFDESIASIGDGAFSGLWLREVILWDNIESIGEYAFYGTHIKYVLIPDSVTSVKHGAFADSSLMRVVIGNGLKEISDECFSGCDSLFDIRIGNGVETIGEWAFAHCGTRWTFGGEYYYLRAITIPANVKSIGSNAFAWCPYLKEVYFEGEVAPEGIDRAFVRLYGTYGDSFHPDDSLCEHEADDPECDVMTILYIPNDDGGYAGIGNSWTKTDRSFDFNKKIVFHTYSNDQILTREEVIAQLEAAATEGTIKLRYGYIAHFYNPYGVAGIGTKAFAELSNNSTGGLHGVALDNGIITKIGAFAFAGCHSLSSVEIPDRVSDIEDSAFRSCAFLRSIQTGNGLQDISANMLDSCVSLENITIGSKVVRIGDYAFGNCFRLESVTVPDNVRKTGVGAFYNNTGIQSATLSNGQSVIEANLFASCVNLISVKIPDSVKEIQINAFLVCRSLKSITIPANVKQIGGCAFSGCKSLAKVTFKSITAPTIAEGFGGAFIGIAYGAVGYVPAGANIHLTILDGPTPPTPAGYYKMSYNDLTIKKTISFGDLELVPKPGDFGIIEKWNGFDKFFVIPDKLDGMAIVEIAPDAFAGKTALQRVIISDSVAAIGAGAFENCGGLTEIGFRGAPPAVGENAFSAGNKDTVIYYDAAFAKQWAPNGETTWNDC